MSIADKITSIETHLQADWESIENLGGTAEDKNIENIASAVNGIYDNLPKTTGEDTSLSLTTLKGKMNTTLKGDTQQNTYSGKNLYPSGTSTQTIGGITFTPQENGSLKVKGTSTYANYYVAGADGQYVEVANISNIAEAVTLSVSGMQEGIQVYVVGSRLGAKGIANSSGSIGFTTILNDTYRIFIRVVTEYSVDTTLYIQLEKGSSATSFEKYVGGTASPNPTYPQDIEVVTGTQTITISNSDNTETQTQTISLGDIELCKIGNYQDYLYKSGDKWYKKEQIKKVVFNGSENWELDINHQRAYTAAISNLILKPSSNDEKLSGISDKLIIETFTEIYANKKQGLGCSTGGAVSVHINGVTDTNTTANQFKTWLASNNIALYYVLATPNDIEITDTNLITQLNNLEKLKSYNGVTNISSSGNLSAILSVSALKGE